MKKLVSSGRLFAFGVLVVTLIALCVVTLYKLQIIEGAAYYEESQNNQASNQTVTAARGNILDRYGRVLVSNRECYNLKISDTRLFSDEVEDPNAVILEMINMVEAAGETYIDDLPITKEPPFEYTDMTALQRTLLTAYLDSKGLDEDTTAVELMSYFRTRYDIANSYNAEEMRKIASVRYALNVRYSINTNPYVFVEDASIDLISDLMGVVGNVVEVETSYVREYNTQYAAHILGYVQAMSEEDMEKYRPQDENSGYDYDTKVGRDGVEYTFEDWLHGTNGTARVTRTSSGTITSTVYTEDPVPGNHVYLTIDIQLQEAVERILETGIYELQLKRDEDNAKYTMEGKLDEVREDIQGGAIVVVDVKTGEPLAIASYPTFDLSSIIEDYSDLLEAENDPLFNRALNGAYEPGSTFKPCTAIAGLTENIINTETQIECTGLFTKYADQGYAPACWIYTQTDGQLTHGYDNVTEAIKDSCNVFFYTVADNLGIRKLMEYAKNFGLGESTGIELSETTGNMANPDNHLNYDVDSWVDGDTVQAGIGQSDSMFTPLQLAEYCAAIANGGTRHSAAILKSVRSYDYSRQLYQKETEVLSTVDSADYNWAAVQRGMYLMANDITSSSSTVYYALSNYSYNGVSLPVAAKTGTSQLGEDKTNNAIFMCYAPFDDPEIAIAIVVERGQSGANLSKMARNVLDAYFSLGTLNTTAEREYSLLK
ncbi:MAG: penicillin-binding transpeptidase domain-containing protein [Oscillospiraceae bacterium]|jgi:penicillin-binding protein 2|nr:penicillin-binding transpeptidase domain-containing protein [Oscillospiraceae bacterium]